MNRIRQMRNYKDVRKRLAALCEGETDDIAIMATVSQELFASFDGFDWVGFYRVVQPDLLKIGPYQGGHGCLVIPFDKGVCGAAARTGKVQLVDDVEAFDGHIACSASTRSELVMPIFERQGSVRAVLDIDSDQLAFFTSEDVGHLSDILDNSFANAWQDSA